MQNKRIYSLSNMNQMISWPEAALDLVVHHGPWSGSISDLCCALGHSCCLARSISPVPDSPRAQEKFLEWSQPKCWCCNLSDQLVFVSMPEPVPVVRSSLIGQPQVTWSPQMLGAGVSHIHSTLTNNRGTFPKKAK